MSADALARTTAGLEEARAPVKKPGPAPDEGSAGVNRRNGFPNRRERRVVIKIGAFRRELDSQALPELREIGHDRGCTHFVVEFRQDIRSGRLVRYRQGASYVPRDFDTPALRHDGA